MEVRERELPNLGPNHTRESLKDPSSDDGGLVPWLKRCAEAARGEWKTLFPNGLSDKEKNGGIDAMQEAALENQVAARVKQRMMRAKQDGKVGQEETDALQALESMTRDAARCVGFPRFLRIACSLRVFQSPDSLDGVFMLVDAHRKLSARATRVSGRSGAQKRLDRAKIKALTRANAIFEGRTGPVA